MYPNKATLVVVLFNRKSNYTQPFLCITSSKTGIKGEAPQAGVKKGLTVIGVDTRNEMVRSCNRKLY
uniref:Uncharacterized protein n=1 Tax=Magallana gigas TaxID=29159 RepID=A0A8W8NHD4_MAGGI